MLSWSRTLRFHSCTVSSASLREGDDTEGRSLGVGSLCAAHNPRHRKAAASSARSGDRKAIIDYVVIEDEDERNQLRKVRTGLYLHSTIWPPIAAVSITFLVKWELGRGLDDLGSFCNRIWPEHQSEPSDTEKLPGTYDFREAWLMVRYSSTVVCRGSHVDHSAFGPPNAPVGMRAWGYQRPIQPNCGHRSAVRPSQLAGDPAWAAFPSLKPH